MSESDDSNRDKAAELSAYLSHKGIAHSMPTSGWSRERCACPICGGSDRLSITGDGGWQCWGGSCSPPPEFIRGAHSKPCGGDAVDLIRAAEAKDGEALGFRAAAELLAALKRPELLKQLKANARGWSPPAPDLRDFGRDAPGGAPAAKPQRKKRALTPSQEKRAAVVRDVLARRADAEQTRACWSADMRDNPVDLPSLPDALRSADEGHGPAPRSAFMSADEIRPWVERQGYWVFPLEGKSPPKGRSWMKVATQDYATYKAWWDAEFNLGIYAGKSKRIFLDFDRKNFADVLAAARELPAMKESYLKSMAKVQALSADEIRAIADWQIGGVMQAVRDAGGLVHPTPGGGWHVEFLDDGETRPDDGKGGQLHNVNPSSKEGPGRSAEAGWFDSRCGNGFVAAYKRDAALVDASPAVAPTWLKEAFAAPVAARLTDADYELVKQEMDEEDSEGEAADGPTRLYNEALSRLPAETLEVIADHTEVIKTPAGKTKKCSDADVAADLLRPRRLRFLAEAAGKSKDDERFRSGGVFLWKPGDEWEPVELTDFIKDLLRVMGQAGTAKGIGMKKGAVLSRLAEEFHRGHLMSADAPIPPGRRTGPNAIEPMVLDKKGRAISLAKGRCGQPAKQHDDHMLRRRLGVVHDPAATCPEWDRTLHWAMNTAAGDRDPELVRRRVQYLEEILAAGLYQGPHGNRLQEWAWFSGVGGNFKSGCLEVALAIYKVEDEDGEVGFGRELKANQFFKGKYGGDEKVAELATLEGCWLGVVEESEEQHEWRCAVMKTATGAKRFVIRPMRSKERSIPNTWFIIAQGNNIPYAADNSGGWDRRRHILLFENVKPKPEQDPDLVDRIISNELPGVFNRLLAALERIYANGGRIIKPKQVEEAGEAFALDEATPVKRYCDQYLMPAPGETAKLQDAWDDFKIFVSQERDARPEDLKKTMRSFEVEIKGILGHGRVVKPQTGRDRFWQILDCRLIRVEGGTKSDLSPQDFAAVEDSGPLAAEADEPTEAHIKAAANALGLLDYAAGERVSIAALQARTRKVLQGMSQAMLVKSLKEIDGIEVDTDGALPVLINWTLRK